MLHKTGPHIVESYSGRLAGFPLIKLVDASASYVRRVRGECPHALLIVRWVDGNNYPLDDPAQRAKEWYERHAPDIWAMTAEGADRNIVFCGYNERPSDQTEQLAVFEIERLRLVHAGGGFCAVGSWSVGEPKIALERWFVGAVRAHMAARDVYDKHEYWVDHSDIANPWHVARWQFVPELDDMPIVVSESGRDIVEGRGRAGWRHTANREEMDADIHTVDGVYSMYPQVIGHTVYGAGRIYSPWQAFDCNNLVEQWRQECEPIPQPPPPIPEPPPPVPDPAYQLKARVRAALNSVRAGVDEIARIVA